MTSPADVHLTAPERPHIAVPRDDDPAPLSAGAHTAFATAAKQSETTGASTTVIDVSAADRWPTLANVALAVSVLGTHQPPLTQERADRQTRRTNTSERIRSSYVHFRLT